MNWRTAAKWLTDVTIWSATIPVAFWLRLDQQTSQYLPELRLYLLVGVPLVMAAESLFRLHRQEWSRVRLPDLNQIVRGVTLVAFALFLSAVYGQTRGYGMPRSVPIIMWMLAVLLLSGMRVALRLYRDYGTERQKIAEGKKRRVLIVGAGEAGVIVARDLSRHPETGLAPVAFVDDDARKRNLRVGGLPVAGPIDRLPEAIRTYRAEEVLIAMPSAPGSVVRRVVEHARAAGVRYRIIPGLYDLVSGRVAISQIRTVDVEDLLRREPVRLDMDNIAGYLRGKRVLVTGAGGSIGSELARQIARFEPEELLLLGRGENSIYRIAGELAVSHPDLVQRRLIANVCDRERMRDIMAHYRPHAVFHAAAHKHVPLMEENPCEAIRNNVGGTRNVVDLALEAGVQHLVNISTDKAVAPSNLMGLSKRIAEMLVHHAAMRAGKDQVFCSVRFGNVLGSRGSVLPLFRRQLEQGGPLTITDRRMTRFFMTIPEAAQLVLQAGAFGDNDRLYVLDMGEPVRIYDLACDLIRLSGLEPEVDIAIEETGIRPGEKLYEELSDRDENITASPHPKIHTVITSPDLPEDFERQIEALLQEAARCDLDAMLRRCDILAPGFLERYRGRSQGVH